MYSVSQLTKAVHFWLDVLRYHGGAVLLGDSGSFIEKVMAEHAFSVPNQWDSQYYLEMPMMGHAGADLTISRRYVNENLPYPFYLEFDTSQGKTTEPSLFLEVRKPVFKDWGLIQIGLMTGRENTPRRMVFMPAEKSDRKIMPWRTASVRDMLQRLQWGELPAAVAEKLQELEELQWQKIFVHVDKMPDGSWGDTLGIDILGWIPGTEPHVFFRQKKAKKLLQAISRWGFGDGREQILPQCVGLVALPQELGFPAKNFLLSLLSHFKIRYNRKGWLPAKVYLYCEVLELFPT